MENNIAYIDAIFRKTKINNVLENFLNIKNYKQKYSYQKVMENLLEDDNNFSNYTKEEKCNIYLERNDLLKIDNIEDDNIFNIILNYSNLVLKEVEKEPVCRYKYLLSWSEICRHLGEEIFTTSFFAYNDIKFNNNRNFFSWKPIISSDNTRIASILSKGISENHFHIKASGQNDSISWISLMNKISGREDAFKELETEKDTEDSLLYLLVKKAFYIRILLFKEYLKSLDKNNFDDKFLEKYKPEIILKDNFIKIRINEIEKEVEIIKKIHGFEFKLNNKTEIPDYCIFKNISESNKNNNILLYGERFFLYNIFKLFFTDKLNEQLKELLFIYLLIKSNFRSNLIQLNNKIGLSNFVSYERKKELFIESSFYEKFLHKMSIVSSTENQNIVSLEARITPKESSLKIAQSIKDIDNNVRLDYFSNLPNNKKEIKHFYTLHFIKKYDENINEYLKTQKNYTKIKLMANCRNSDLRKNIEAQAIAISIIRNAKNKYSQRIFGIDSAGIEIGCRPEVFAQAFRFLKNHIPKKNNTLIKDITVPKIKATFHAGEDFLDMVDGLRYIDEAIKFCCLEQGDRLGHALALGLNPKDFYNIKKRTLYLPKQDLLDNIAWLLSRIRKYSINISGLTDFLENEFNKLFLEIYKGLKNKYISHDIYFKSWKLRGDNPYLYSSGKYEKKLCLTYWDHFSKNSNYPKEINLHEIEDISNLYFLYHFHFNSKIEGSKIQKFEVEEKYIKAVEIVQKEMQFEISRKNIGIETNPTSNYVISSLEKYSKHPITKWFNLGLEMDSEKIKNSPQLFVSINTDDQSVFNTYLENEYAIMALSLEKEKDDLGNYIYNPSMIYDWLDRIRQMGINQSFKKI